MSSNNKRPALGKGLSALLESSNTDITSNELSDNTVLGSVALIEIDSIETNPFNPRIEFEESALVELSESISEHGIIQPLTVRKLGRNKFQLISGERRFRASKIAKLKQVPVYIRVANDQSMLEMALVENIQREDLNAIEIGLSYQRLIEECKLTQEELSKKLSKSRTSITNHIRLLKLPVEIQLAVRENKIAMGHARSLVSCGEKSVQLSLLQKVINEDLSVRELENLIKSGNQPKIKTISKSKPNAELVISADYEKLINSISKKLSSKIKVLKGDRGKGKISIHFNSNQDFEKIINLLSEKLI